MATFSGNTSLDLPPNIFAPAGLHFFWKRLGKIFDNILSKNHSFAASDGTWNMGYPPSATYHV
jgi:hypothetical protein